jgi:inner membrane protein
MMILGLINERKSSSEITKHEVMQQWSMLHTIRGPILTIPYTARIYNSKDKVYEEEIRQSYFLPKTLNIKGEIFPQQRYRSIYQVIVYESEVNISGHFDYPDYEKLKIAHEDIQWNKAELLIAINDLRGITNLAELQWGKNKFAFSPGMDNHQLGTNGISIQLPINEDEDFSGDFICNLSLKGSESLQFAPLGETTQVNLVSKWNDPGFIGNFLPNSRDISNEGFSANWKVLHFNRNFPQLWKENTYRLTESDFGVELITVADHYQKNTRNAKYGILVILFTFLSFFLNEIITKQRIHLFQYILVGFSVLMFYLLLLSISEHLGFNLAYLISAISVLIMVFLYSRTFLNKFINSLLLTTILSFSFGFIFILMQLESYALSVGSIGLFFVLALTMFFTRKINWYTE